MIDTTTSRRIADAMERLHAAGERSKARMRHQQPVVGSCSDVDEFGFVITRPVRADEAAQEQLDAQERFDAAMRRLSRSPVLADADDEDDTEPVDDAVDVPAPVVAISEPTTKCKLVPNDPEITAEL